MTGLALRHIVLTVPACGNCNSRINDFPSPNVSDRRRKAQESILRSGKKLLERPYKSGHELRELGPLLRSVAIKNNAKTDELRARLQWPDDPFFDVRAFQKAGIEDPVSLGMCDEFAKGLSLPPRHDSLKTADWS